jgi:hypothetical protein
MSREYSIEHMVMPSEEVEKHRSKRESQIVQDKLRERDSARRKCRENFKTIDFFGQSINLTWNGEDTFKTTFGASVSLILILILIGYSIVSAIDLFTLANPNVTKTTLMQTNDDIPFRP